MDSLFSEKKQYSLFSVQMKTSVKYWLTSHSFRKDPYTCLMSQLFQNSRQMKLPQNETVSFPFPPFQIMEMDVGMVSCAANNAKRKKRRSFIQKQKQFAKKGSFGRGTQLTQDTYEYFINILKAVNNKRGDEEEMGILSSNVLVEIQGKETEYCCNQIVSRVVEELLPFSSDVEFSSFILNFSENLRPIFSDPFGSHVLQQTLIVAYKKYKKLENEENNKLSVKFYDYILKVSKFFYNNLEDFIWDTYSNAIGRTVLSVLSGNPVKGEIKLNFESYVEEEVKVPTEFSTVIKEFVKRIISWPHFSDLCGQLVNSIFLQYLLLASKNSNESSALLDKIITHYENNNLDLKADENIPFVRLLEVVLYVSNEDIYKKIYKLIFKENLVELAVSKNGNFAVQRLLNSCKSEKIFLKIFAKLQGCMETIVTVGNYGILLALVKKCRDLGLVQGECLMMLTRVFQVKDPRNLFPSLCSLTSLENVDAHEVKCTLHGCLLIQELLNFKKPITVVNSLLELTQNRLISVLCDVRGCHITDAFMNSSTIGEKSRDKLFKKLQGQFVKLAVSKHGSRSLDAIWTVIHIHQKILLAEELKANQSELYGNIFGKGFARKIQLDNFRRDKEEWIKLQKKSATAEKLFSDIIPVKKRKKN